MGRDAASGDNTSQPQRTKSTVTERSPNRGVHFLGPDRDLNRRFVEA